MNKFETTENMKVTRASETRVEVGLIRRLSLFVEQQQGQSKPSRSKKNARAFSHRYLGLKKSKEAARDFDPNVRIVTNALSIANSYDRASAIRYVDYMAKHSSFDLGLVKYLLAPDIEARPPKLRVSNSSDYSLFHVDELSDLHSPSIRQCYERELGKAGIQLPFGKADMAKIYAVLTSNRTNKSMKLFSELEHLIVSFLHVSWPLFSPMALTVSLSYLRQEPVADTLTHEENFKTLSRYGFEKLQIRLLILRAVNSDPTALDFLKRNPDWSSAQLAPNLEESIRAFIHGNREFHALDSNSNKDNPIALLIQLSMFVNCHTGHYDFLTRLLSAYEVDPSIVRFLNWDQLRPEVTAAKKFATPELVFLAAILRKREVYSKYEYIENKYGPGGAGADLRKVATYHRSELKHTRARFISSLLKLPKKAAQATSSFLLAPGMIDRIANIFPTEGSLVHPNHKDSLSLAFEFRIACLNAMRQKKLISRAEWTSLFNESRTALRKLRYDEKAQAGRLRIKDDSLANEIKIWRQMRRGLFSSNKLEKTSNFASSSHAFHADLLSGDLADYLVYQNRLAFDLQLANNLRHFFLSHKILTSIKEGMPSGFDETANAKNWLSSVDGHIEKYCRDWITISRKRSYFAGLKASLKSQILEFLSGTINSEVFDANISKLAILGFDRLLADCRKAWKEQVKDRIQVEIAKHIEQFSVDQMIADRVRLNVDEAFDVTESWLAINRSEYPTTFLLKEQIFFEAIHFKSGKEFRKQFSVEVAKNTPNVILRSTWDIELNSDWIDTIVALTDNLIENACKYSGLRDATPISFLLVQSQSQLQIIVSNPVRADELGKIRAKAPNIKSALSCEITEDILRGKGGTGLIRVRYAGSKVDPKKFELTFNESSLDRGKIEFVATFRGIESDLVNVATQNISS